MKIVNYKDIKVRAAEIFADIKKSHEQMDAAAKEKDPAKDLTEDKVVLMMIHSLRGNNIEVNFSSTPDDLNFVNGKPDVTKTQVLPKRRQDWPLRT